MADSRLLANQRLWVSPEVDVTSRLAEVVQNAGGSLTRVLTSDIFALVVTEIVHGTREMNFAVEHDLAIVTEQEAIDQIEAQIKAAAVPLLTEPVDDLAVDDLAVDDFVVVSAPEEEPEVREEPETASDNDLDDLEVVDDVDLDDADAVDLDQIDVPDNVPLDQGADDEPAGDFDAAVEVSAPLVVEAGDEAVAGDIPAGWYPVAGSPGDERFHDGAEWTAQFRSGDGDPLAASMAFMVDEKNRWLAAGVLPAIAVIIGSLGPWANLSTDFGGVSVPGVEVTGALAVPLAMLSSGALAFAALRMHRAARLGGTIGFGLLALLGLYETTNLDAQVADTSFANPSVGWGLWLVILGSLAGVAVGVMLARLETDDQAE